MERFSQGMLLRVPGGARQADLRAALQAVLEHHDALRLRLALGGEMAIWRLEVLPREAIAAGASLRRIDAIGLDDEGLRMTMRLAREPWPRPRSGGCRPPSGVMLQAAWLDGARSGPGCCWLSIHHLSVDGVSWRILVPDLEAAWRAAAAGEPIELPARSGPRSAAGRSGLRRMRRMQSVADELSHWRETLSEPSLLLLEGWLDPARDMRAAPGICG